MARTTKSPKKSAKTARTADTSAAAKSTKPRTDSVQAAVKTRVISADESDRDVRTNRAAHVTRSTTHRGANLTFTERLRGGLRAASPSRFVAEFIGTFTLVSVIITVLSGKFSPLTYFVPQNVVETQLKPVAGHALTTDVNSFLQNAGVIPFMATAVISALVYLVLTMILGRISGAHLNPAITIARITQRSTRLVEGTLFVLAQLLGALLGMSLMTTIGVINPDTLVLHLADWNLVYAELLGSFIFSFGVASAVLYHKSLTLQSWVIGGSFLMGAIVAAAGGAKGFLNPAVAFGTNAIATLNGQQRLMLYLAYVVAPILGAIIGFALFRLISREIRDNSESKI